MNLDGFLEEMLREKQQNDRADAGKIIFDQILAKVPSFKQAMFSFEAKAGVFGPVSYWDESLRQGLAEEDGCWFVNKESGNYEFRSDYDDAIEHGFEDVASFDVGSAVAEILNNNNELLVKALFGDSKSAFSNGNSLTYGVLEVSIVPQESSLEVGEDDSGRSCCLSEGFRGFAASFRSTDQVSNAVMVP